VLAEVREAAGNDPDIHILLLPPTAHLEINALQRAATIVFQKSTREGFGLTVAEALWKGKPVIGGATGGITVQVIPGETGYTVSSPEGAAFYAKRLLNEPDRLAAMGRQAKEYVRHRFLITRHLQEYLALIIRLCRGTR
jgi:trehalose synthase